MEIKRYEVKKDVKTGDVIEIVTDKNIKKHLLVINEFIADPDTQSYYMYRLMELESCTVWSKLFKSTEEIIPFLKSEFNPISITIYYSHLVQVHLPY